MSSVDPPAPGPLKLPPLVPPLPPPGRPSAGAVSPPPAVSPMAPYVPPGTGNGLPKIEVNRPAKVERKSPLGPIKLPDVRSPGAAAACVVASAATSVVEPRAVRIAAEEASEEEEVALSENALKVAPPFLVSMLVHMALVIVLALITIGGAVRNHVELAAVYADTRGLQLINDVLESPSAIDLETLQPELSYGLTPVENPFAAPPTLTEVSPAGRSVISTVEAPSIGRALTGREVGMKKVLLPIYGGTATTESSVVAGLEWLKRQQKSDGGWSLVGPYPDGAQFENRCAATAMALLAFQGFGTTHLSSGGQTPDYHDAVKRGWDFLLKMQDKDGVFVHESTHNQRTYAQAQATIAICEIYGMTKDEKFKRPAQLALDYAHKAQSPDLGGWRYEPRTDSDVSVTGWYVMALQSGLMAGLEVQSPNLNAISEFLDKASIENGTQYCYQIGGKPSLTMTAEAMLCRQYLGWRRDDPRMRAGIDQILASRIDYDEDMNVYYWYYATQACHHMDGPDWDRWNEVMREKVPAAQVKTGSNRGSWNPNADRWGAHGGRMYVTCLSVFMLESYYRHLPIYQWRVR